MFEGPQGFLNGTLRITRSQQWLRKELAKQLANQLREKRREKQQLVENDEKLLDKSRAFVVLGGEQAFGSARFFFI